MKTRISTLIFVLAVPALLQGQSPAPSAGKIGIVNIQEAIATTGEGKKAFQDVQKKFQPRQQDLQRQNQEIQALQDRLQKQGTTLSDEESRRLSRDLEEKQRIFKRATEDADADYRAEGQDIIQRIGRKMVPLINDYAQQTGYALVFDPAAAQVPIYYQKDSDITEEIIKRYDAANPVKADATDSAPPAPRAPAPKTTATNPKPAAATPKPTEKPKP